MKIRPVGAGLFHADGKKDRQANTTKLITAFCNFSKALQMTCYRIALKVLSVSRKFQVKIRDSHEVYSYYCGTLLLVCEAIIEKNHNL
jgi:hypothetical protein